jgi:hypothetical protein
MTNSTCCLSFWDTRRQNENKNKNTVMKVKRNYWGCGSGEEFRSMGFKK